MFKYLLSIFAVFLVASGVMVGAANAATPGDLLYSLDVALEQLRIELASTPDQAISLRIASAEERLSEASHLLAEGKTDLIDQTLASFEESLDQIAPLALAADGDDAQSASDALDDAFSEGDDPLDEPQDGETPEPEEDPTESEYSYYCTSYDDEGAPQHPVGTLLATEFNGAFEDDPDTEINESEIDYADVMSMFCNGYGFGEIRIAFTAAKLSQANAETSENPDEAESLADIILLREEGLGWGEIMQSLGLISHPLDKSKVDDEVSDDDGEDSEDDAEDAEDDSDELAEEKDDDESGKTESSNYCSSYMDAEEADMHPTGAKLAAWVEELKGSYESDSTEANSAVDEGSSVTGDGEEELTAYQEVMQKFCEDGYGFGELKLVYKILEDRMDDLMTLDDFDTARDEIYTMREVEGMGWGNIMKEFDLIGKDRDKSDKDNGKPEGTGKPENTGKPESLPSDNKKK